MDLKMWKKIFHRTSVCIKLLFVLEIPIISYAVTLMYLICYLLEKEQKKIMLDLLSVNANSSDMRKKKRQKKHTIEQKCQRNTLNTR